LPAQNNDQPLLAAQFEVLLKQKLNPEIPTYNIGQYADIRGAIDPALFQAALQQVIVEAEALRVQIIEGSDGPLQVITCSREWSMPFIDLGGESDPEAAALGWMKADLARVIDLRHDPLFNFALFELGPERFLFYQRVHHIVNDAFSRALVARRVAEVYTSLANGLPDGGSAFGPLRLLIEEEERYRASRQFAEDRRYWLERLAGAPEPVSLASRPASVFSSFLRRSESLDPDRAERLRMVAQNSGTSLPQIITAVMAAYLHRMTGADEVILGLVVNARSDATSQNIPGMLSNVLPLRLKVVSGMTVLELIQEVGQEIWEGLPHQRYRSKELSRELGPGAADRKLYGPEISFMSFDYDPHFAGHRATRHNLSNGCVEDLSIAVYDRSEGGGVQIDLDANPGLYTTDDLEAHGRRFLKFLEAVAADPYQKIWRIEALTAQERRKILEELNETRHEVLEATLPALFERQVERSPEAEAVVHDGSRLSYRELNKRANRLARLLIEKGIGPESLVALAMPRSPETIVALLGILKAGAAYLPIDPDYPPDRIAFMLEDAEPALLLSVNEVARRLGALSLESSRHLLLDSPDTGRALAEYHSNNPPAESSQPGLRHLHLRLHWQAQGRRRHPSERGAARLQSELRTARRRPGDVTTRSDLLRRIDFRDLGQPPQWRQAGALLRWGAGSGGIGSGVAEPGSDHAMADGGTLSLDGQ
jgi:nonribosomal peptide synthetase DhbF